MAGMRSGSSKDKRGDIAVYRISMCRGRPPGVQRVIEGSAESPPPPAQDLTESRINTFTIISRDYKVEGDLVVEIQQISPFAAIGSYPRCRHRRNFPAWVIARNQCPGRVGPSSTVRSIERPPQDCTAAAAAPAATKGDIDCPKKKRNPQKPLRQRAVRPSPQRGPASAARKKKVWKNVTIANSGIFSLRST